MSPQYFLPLSLSEENSEAYHQLCDIQWIYWKFLCPSNDSFVLLHDGDMSDYYPHPPPSFCPPFPAQLLGSRQWSWTVIDAVGSPRDFDLSRLSGPAPCAGGSWIGKVSEKVSRGRKNLVQPTYPTKDSISLRCATPYPLLAPGTSWSQPPQLPGRNIPLQQRGGSSQRVWTVIELEVVLITAHAQALLWCRGLYNMLTPPSFKISKNRQEDKECTKHATWGTLQCDAIDI